MADPDALFLRGMAMNKRIGVAILLGSLSLTTLLTAQQNGPPPFGPGGPGGFGGPMGQQRKLVKQFDKDGDGRLNKEERQAARDFLKKQGAGGSRGGFGPGNFLAGPLREALDADKDGKLTKEELLVGVKKFFANCDKDKKGSLDEAQIAQGLGHIIPQPPGFPGGPGGPPGGRGGPGGPPGGPPDGPGGLPQPGQIMPGPLQERLKLTAEKKKQVAALQKEVDAKLATILTEEEKKTLQQMRQRFGGPGGFRGFGPGNFVAGGIARRADADKDGKVTLTELTAAAELLFQEADKDKDGKLDQSELVAAFSLLMPAPPGFGPPGGFGGRGNREPPKPGQRLSPADVKAYPHSGLYDPTVLRTFFLEFEDDDWEAELADFKGTDVEVPATLTVDGKRYPGVGVHFRGMSSYMGVPAGSKRSLNLSLDFAHPKQRLYGYKTLNLLNSHEDGSFMSTVLYSHIARQYIPAPKANFVQVVINGESWGVYASAQQFNKEFVAENFKTTKGTRWKVRGSPGGGGGLDYLGDNVEDYKRRYEIKSGDNPKAWQALIDLCKTLNQTPPDKLEQALASKLDLDGLFWFLALDMALINDDGYWIRASDYSLYLDGKGKFHVIPHDINEAFRPAGGPGFGPGPGGFGTPSPRPAEILSPMLRDMLRLSDEEKKQVADLQKDTEGKLAKILTDDQKAQFKGPQTAEARSPVDLDPLYGLNDARKPLRSKVLAVPALRQRYLHHVRAIAEKWLDWKNLGPVVAQYRALIEKGIESDTRKLSTLAEFQKLTADTAEPDATGGRRMSMSLRAFADQRRHYLLNYSESKRP
jgi:spore coat protein CotH